MNIEKYYVSDGEKPLDNIAPNGGFCSIFRTIAVVGDSLSSGEFETVGNGSTNYHDIYEQSWGQYIARMTGSKVYNFSRGGMTAKEYLDSFGEANRMFDRGKACQAYIIALGVNDLFGLDQPVGKITDKGAETFASYYAELIRRYKEISPDAFFFLLTMPEDRTDAAAAAKYAAHSDLLYAFSEALDKTYVIDLRKYGPDYSDEKFKRAFYLHGHLNPMGYKLTADMVASYIDYIVRSDPFAFRRAGLIGTGFHGEDKD